MKKFIFLLTGLFWASYSLSAQDYFPKNDGVRSTNKTHVVFTNATLHVSPDKTIENGTLVIREGKVIAAKKKANVPKNSQVIDLKGKHVYPSFIDAYTEFGIKKLKKDRSNPYAGQPQYASSRQGYYWNDHIRPEASALDEFTYDKDKAKTFLKSGFGVVGVHPNQGIARGTGIVVALNSKGTTSEQVLDSRQGQYFSFRKSTLSKQVYPTSLMGAMALLRQMYSDADWYAKGNAKTTDLSLEALNRNRELTPIIEAGNLYNVLRADKVGDAAGLQYTIVGKGEEYQRIDAIKKTGATMIVPLDFPKAYDVENPYETRIVSYGAMKHWNQAPTNPAVLSKNGVVYALTSYGLKDRSEFLPNLRKAVRYGLSPETALATLTTIPAEILGQQESIGKLEENFAANFFISDQAIFEDKAVIFEHWVQGMPYTIKDVSLPNVDGNYDLSVSGQTYTLELKNSLSTIKGTVKQGDTPLTSKVAYDDRWLSITIQSADSTKKEYTRLVGQVQDENTTIRGNAFLPNGGRTTFTAMPKPDGTDTNTTAKKEDSPEVYEVMPLSYPNKAYGFDKLPVSGNYLFRNATVWTNEEAGVLEEADVLVTDGKIAAVGQFLVAKGATVIDATGKHLTPGIVDEHSHIAAAAINEAGHNSSAEVTMEDVVQPDDIEIYRNLAGGVTSIQLLHGSANPIGGQSAILKLKWGQMPEDMIYQNSPKFIKFALGENVKQSNWQSMSRFPQSRMGVEQVYMDYFSRARNYEKSKENKETFRRDEELETLLEILKGERFISCHSYVQSEINMLMKLAEQFGFRVNTFTHILEGYKVADKMAKHGAGGSTFSDWWAYKFEVNDAIPYNAAIMHEQGVTVAINSDDAEMSRRLNQETAKTVKYGGVSEEDALKFVTLNPAKLLHIDDRVGSIKVGKDADLVLWTDHPLSIYSKAEKTMIEGAIYFDLEKDQALKQKMKKDKNILISQMLQEKVKGNAMQAPKKKKKEHAHCDSEGAIF